MPDDERDERVTGDPGRVGGVDRRRDRLVQPGHLLDAAVSLAGQVDDSDDRRGARRAGRRRRRSRAAAGKRGALGEADLPLPGAVEGVVRVGDDGQEGGAVAVGAQHRAR